MRLIKTFVLHLYFDDDAPERLCGNLRPLETRDLYPFKDETGLMNLLQKICIASKDRGQSDLSNYYPTRS